MNTIVIWEELKTHSEALMNECRALYNISMKQPKEIKAKIMKLAIKVQDASVYAHNISEEMKQNGESR